MIPPKLLMYCCCLGESSLNAPITGGIIPLHLVRKKFICVESFCLIPSAGELIFLLWGIKVCIAVRKARTYFDEAKLISWSIYNIAIVNSLMAVLQ